MTCNTLLHFHDVIIREDDFCTLDEHNWLNDTILEFHMEYLERTFVTSETSIQLLRPAIVQLITHTHDPRQIISALPPRLNEQNAIFIPVNDGRPSAANSGSHWSLLVFLRPSCAFYYYDSMRYSNIQEARHTARQMALLLGLTKKPEFIPTSTPQQNNGADCGVYVIGITDSLVNRFMELKGKPIEADKLMMLPKSHVVEPTKIRNKLKCLIRSLGHTD
ncbi:hypothetical protein J3Q64DRAFT_1694223 [Phycomyces blakesleeanus]|uniref:Ubiquitin-like protease family profile domain-containing protein n=2 Tax=Phycomyces blakesleeanus TaxID=4837 RepID=A0A167QGL6_PHYB8|nr:hypothetical protein PHYBLDRAFT_58709 [Phycomyces blakesleeanus NRRL 1555(-)]OAD79661.1 hypothetical protein PHYBLDRAFT_58709 [Phycomyces blakesleeanus NRRL 1555(-)]|eukprot:XP_018297701.1 hypothetical protein PHYBLDRAFT_58709 [Phycomyces blakesleeanus NRRL 1555(-)]